MRGGGREERVTDRESEREREREREKKWGNGRKDSRVEDMERDTQELCQL